jgi:hypothetical protein
MPDAVDLTASLLKDKEMSKSCKFALVCIVVALVAVSGCQSAGPSMGSSETYDTVIYGGTAAAVSAAVQARRMGKTVVIVCPEKHLGGLTAGGLGWTDSGRKEAVGGISREFYQRVKKHYDKPEAWVHQKPGEYSRYRIEDDAMWVFEPHVAERTFEQLVAEYEIPVFRDEWLKRKGGVKKNGTRIVSITMLCSAARLIEAGRLSTRLMRVISWPRPASVSTSVARAMTSTARL